MKPRVEGCSQLWSQSSDHTLVYLSVLIMILTYGIKFTESTDKVWRVFTEIRLAVGSVSDFDTSRGHTGSLFPFQTLCIKVFLEGK